MRGRIGLTVDAVVGVGNMGCLYNAISSRCTKQPFLGSDVNINHKFELFARFANILAASFLVLIVLLPQTAHAALTIISPSIEANFTSVAAEEQTTSVNIIVILAEFSDVKHVVSRETIEKQVFKRVADYYQEVSYGKLSITGDITQNWIVLPTKLSSYGNLDQFLGIQTERFKLAFDVIKAADSEVDFRKYDQVIIVLPVVNIVNYALWQPIVTNDACSVKWVTVQQEHVSAGTFAHELGHALGLPDLYDYMKAEYKGKDTIPYVGKWCLMSSASAGVHFCAFSKMLLGWIPAEQIKVVSHGSTEFITLEPLENKTGGTQVIKITSYGQAYYLVEARRKIGFDEELPDEGVLVTRVDESLAVRGTKGGDYFLISGPFGFVQVQDAEPGTSSLNDATFDVRSGKKNVFTKLSDDVGIVVLDADDYVYQICVTTPESAKQMSKVIDVVSQSKSRASQAKFDSPEAQSLLKEADNRYASVIDFLKTKNYEGAMQEADTITSLIDEAISAQGNYAEVMEVGTKAEDAIRKAESEGRIYGLDEAKSLVRQAKSRLDAYDYDQALVLAAKAKKIAEAATLPPNPIASYGWYIGIVLAVALAIGAGIWLIKRSKGRSRN